MGNILFHLLIDFGSSTIFISIPIQGRVTNGWTICPIPTQIWTTSLAKDFHITGAFNIKDTEITRELFANHTLKAHRSQRHVDNFVFLIKRLKFGHSLIDFLKIVLLQKS